MEVSPAMQIWTLIDSSGYGEADVDSVHPELPAVTDNRRTGAYGVHR
jgi:hypothetical protein